MSEQIKTERDLTEAEKNIRETLSSAKQFTAWTLYEKPHLNSLRPDFILTHPRKGILLIEVRDWQLEAPAYLKNAQVLGTNGNNLIQIIQSVRY